MSPLLTVIITLTCTALTLPESAGDTEFTFLPKYQETWNGAADACRERGLDMLRADTVEIFHALSVIMKNYSVSQKDFWTGLHSKGTGDGQEASYVWQDCSTLGATTFWDREDSDKLCVFLETWNLNSDTKVWKAERCHQQNPVICQSVTSGCSRFSKFTSYPPFEETPVVHDQLSPCSDDHDECAGACLDELYNDTRCMGFTFSGHNCTLHFAPSPAHVWAQVPPANLYIPFCYTAVINNTEQKSRLYSRERRPIQGCYSTNVSIPPTSVTTEGQVVTLQSSLPSYSQDSKTSFTAVSVMGYTSALSIAQSTIRSLLIETTSLQSDLSSTESASTTYTPSISPMTPIIDDLISQAMTTPITPVDDVTSQPMTSGTTSGVGHSSTEVPLTGVAVEGSPTMSTSNPPISSPSLSFCRMICTCHCPHHTPPSNLTSQQKEVFIQTLVEKLAVQKSNLSSNQRKYISAADPRASSQGIGCLGILFLVVVFGGIVVLDFPFLISEIKTRLMR